MIFGMRLQKKLQNKWDLTGEKIRTSSPKEEYR